MFFGAKLVSGKGTSIEGGEILHISQASLVDPTDSAPTYVQLTINGDTHCICVLQKGISQSVTMDIFFEVRQNVQLSLKGGKNEVHVCGYFEPLCEANDDDDDDADDVEMQRGALSSGRKSAIDAFDDDDEFDDDDDDEGDDVELDEDDDSEDGTPRVEEVTDEGESRMPKKKMSIANGVSAAANEDSEGNEDEDDDDSGGDSSNQSSRSKKRPAPKLPSTQHDAKKAKIAPGQKKNENAKVAKKDQKKEAAPNSGDSEAFKQSLIAYLKKNGKTALGSLGQKVKKPNGVSVKLGKFIKDNSNTFKCENGSVTLV